MMRRWLEGKTSVALRLQRPLPDAALQIVSRARRRTAGLPERDGLSNSDWPEKQEIGRKKQKIGAQ
jgi:hypothetical protein